VQLNKDFCGLTQEQIEREVKKEDNVVTSIGRLDEIRRVMHETIRNDETLDNIKEKYELLETEISRINGILNKKQNKEKKEDEERSDINDANDLVIKITLLEKSNEQLKSLISELRGEEPITVEERENIVVNSNNISDRNNNVGVQKKGILIKDLVTDLNINVMQQKERISRLNSRIDAMNKEILDRVKRDLAMESNKILEEFRVDLKFSIAKIEDQMKEKVDRFNMEDFTRKFEKKILFEVGSKIDRIDLRKNNLQINRKVYLYNNLD
jgi:hypothetical protein